MSVSQRLSSWVCLAAALTFLAWPSTADAQRRRGPGPTTSRAVPRPPGRTAGRPAGQRGRRVIRTNVWYGPRYGFYSPYYYGRFGYYGYPYWGQYPYYGRYEERGSLRIDVEPEETEVYVDGYYAGIVDSYDGFFQRLHLPPGPHDVELRLEGYHSIQEQVYVAIGSTYHITHQMEPLGPGETTPPPPIPPDPPEAAAFPSGPGSPPPDAPDRPLPLPGRPDPRPTRPVAGFGTLAVRVQPDDAVILVNGEEWSSPRGGRLELELGAGRHRVEVQREGYESYATEVSLRSGEVTAVNISLPRLEGEQ